MSTETTTREDQMAQRVEQAIGNQGWAEALGHAVRAWQAAGETIRALSEQDGCDDAYRAARRSGVAAEQALLALQRVSGIRHFTEDEVWLAADRLGLLPASSMYYGVAQRYFGE